MGQSSRKRKRKSGKGKLGQRHGITWSFSHVAMALLIGLATGGGVCYQVGYETGRSEARTGDAQDADDARADRHGRLPGHEHYGHDHP